jgi:MFS family permease
LSSPGKPLGINECVVFHGLERRGFSPYASSMFHSSSDALERSRVWNRDFFLLWQGQLVSSVGNVAFNIALGFWVLRRTGSSAAMGSVIAVSALVQALGGPAAGVFADRWPRKWIIVATDFLRGIIILGGAALAFADLLQVWMVLVGAVGIGACAALFRPAVRASVPDLVPESQLDRGNSAFSIIQQLSGIVGNSVGGALYAFVGAPIMFLLNGISFLLSGVSEAFMRLPHHIRPGQTPAEAPEDVPAPALEPVAANLRQTSRTRAFFGEMKEGLRFVWGHPVLRLQFFNIGVLNFFLTMGGVLYLPYFERSEQFAPTDYGLTMAILTGGALLGSVLLQFVTLKPEQRFPVFATMAVVFSFGRTLIVSFPNLGVILSLAFVSGFAVSLINTIVMSTVQAIVPKEMRGKVFGLTGSLSGGLIPLGIAIGGVLGDLFPIPLIVPATGIVTALGFLPLLLDRRVARAYGRAR